MEGAERSVGRRIRRPPRRRSSAAAAGSARAALPGQESRGRRREGQRARGDPAELRRGRKEHLTHLPAHDFFFFKHFPPKYFFFLRYVKSGKSAFPFLVFPFLSLFTLSARFFAGTFPSSGRAGYLAELTSWSGGCVCFSALPCLRSRKSSLKPLERLLIDASSLPLDSLPAQEDLGWDWETRRHFRLQNTLF